MATSSNATLDVWGSKAIAACAPANQVGTALTTIIELYREGLPHLLGSSLWKDKALKARNAGDEYLNLEFGYKPLANDIAQFMSIVVNLNRILKQYERDAGKVVRRRMSFPPERSISSVKIVSGGVITAPSNSALQKKSPSGETHRVREIITKRWFSGAFTYYIPSQYRERDGSVNHAKLVERFLGLELTPDVVWELAPWSWAVDWFTNAGAIISNLTSWARDGQVLKYGYIMEHFVCRDTYLYIGDTGLYTPVIPFPMTLVSESKKNGEEQHPSGSAYS
jgi:hypothetical protein